MAPGGAPLWWGKNDATGKHVETCTFFLWGMSCPPGRRDGEYGTGNAGRGPEPRPVGLGADLAMLDGSDLAHALVHVA